MRTRLNIDLPPALQDCKQAVDLDEGAASHRDSLGWIYLHMGDAARAKRAFDSAIKLEARPFSLHSRELAQLRLNDAASGEQDLAAVRNRRPSIDDEVRKQGIEFAQSAARPASPGS